MPRTVKLWVDRVGFSTRLWNYPNHIDPKKIGQQDARFVSDLSALPK